MITPVFLPTHPPSVKGGKGGSCSLACYTHTVQCCFWFVPVVSNAKLALGGRCISLLTDLCLYAGSFDHALSSLLGLLGDALCWRFQGSGPCSPPCLGQVKSSLPARCCAACWSERVHVDELCENSCYLYLYYLWYLNIFDTICNSSKFRCFGMHHWNTIHHQGTHKANFCQHSQDLACNNRSKTQEKYPPEVPRGVSWSLRCTCGHFVGWTCRTMWSSTTSCQRNATERT